MSTVDQLTVVRAVRASQSRDSLPGAARALRWSPAATNDASRNARASVVHRTQDGPTRARRARAGMTNCQIVKEGVRDLNTDFRGKIIINLRFPTAKTQRPQREFALIVDYFLTDGNRRSRTAAARVRERQSTREHLGDSWPFPGTAHWCI